MAKVLGQLAAALAFICVDPLPRLLAAGQNGGTAVAGATPQVSRPRPDVCSSPITEGVADEMLRLGQVTTEDVVLDLGSGDGTIVLLAAQKYRARAVGIELTPDLINRARATARTRGVADRVTFIQGDLFKADISRATLVTLCLSPGINFRLEPKLRRELQPGTRIVSRMFGIADWKPDEIVRAGDGSPLFLWTVPRPPLRTPDIFFAPTRQGVVDEMLTLAKVTADDVVYDLGSGDGRIVILAAQKYGARGVGVELDPPLVEASRQVARDGGVADKATFVEGDLFATDISAATVVTLYLSPGLNRQLEPKLRRELRPGTRIVSHEFRIGNWAPEATVRAKDGSEIFLWTVPAP